MNYKYGMRSRPFSIGCQPKEGLVEVLESDETRRYHNVLIYDRRLSDEELYKFELEVLTND